MIESALSIHLANLIEKCCEFIDNELRADNFDSPSEAAKPRVELLRQFNFWIDGKMRIIDFRIMNIFRAETVNHRVEPLIDEPQSYADALTSIHTENALRVVLEVFGDESEFVLRVSRFACCANIAHAVHTIGSIPSLACFNDN